MPTLALLALTVASVGFDFDAVGLSDLERAALLERARAELGGLEVVDAPGLVACADADCARAILAEAGASAGAGVRVVKVLQVVRVELGVVDDRGAIAARSSRQLDVEGAARGSLFDDEALAKLARLSPPAGPLDDTAAPRELPPAAGSSGPATVPAGTSDDAARPRPVLAAVAVGIGGAAIALVGAALATNEALVAHSPVSVGNEKERARVFGPVALAVGVAGLAVAVGGPAVLLSLEDAPQPPR